MLKDKIILLLKSFKPFFIFVKAAKKFLKKINFIKKLILYFDKYTTNIKHTNVRGLKIFMEIRSRMDLRRLNYYSLKEPETLDWIDGFEKSNEIIFYDIGANVGLYSLYASIKHFDKIKIFAFEPMSQNISTLSKNIYINKAKNIIPFCLSISDKESIKKLFIPYNRFESSGNRAQFNSDKNIATKLAEKPIIHSEGSVGISIDELCFKYNFPIPNHIKIDIDGNESDIFMGAKKTLKSKELKSILFETINLPMNEYNILKKILADNGFVNQYKSNVNEIFSK
tara:strand:+ start:522 stop:1370 length:849 start_codon:yes stop_codon:yes gene_type:complete